MGRRREVLLGSPPKAKGEGEKITMGRSGRKLGARKGNHKNKLC